MKYTLKRKEDAINFRPFSITIEFEKRSEYVHFHDIIVPKISSNRTSNLSRHIYNMGNGNIDKAEGTI